MNRKRPLLVTLISMLLILTGIGGIVFHAADMASSHLGDAVLVECISALAVVAGAFMLRGSNWARWLAMLWIAAHVIISAFHPVRELAVHLVVFTVFALVLFHPAASTFFRRTETA